MHTGNERQLKLLQNGIKYTYICVCVRVRVRVCVCVYVPRGQGSLFSTYF